MYWTNGSIIILVLHNACRCNVLFISGYIFENLPGGVFNDMVRLFLSLELTLTFPIVFKPAAEVMEEILQGVMLVRQIRRVLSSGVMRSLVFSIKTKLKLYALIVNAID